MIKGLNRLVRVLFFVFGGFFLLMELLPQQKSATDRREGFDSEEFDDIW